jgi:hypothetical protein
VDSTNITDRGWSGADVPPPPNVRRADADVPVAVNATFQGGLAAFLYSALMVLLVPLALLVLMVVPLLAEILPTWDMGGRIVSSIVMALGMICFDLLALVGLGFAGVSLRAARARRQPVALHAASLVLGLGAVFGWALASVAAFIIEFTLWHIKM